MELRSFKKFMKTLRFIISIIAINSVLVIYAHAQSFLTNGLVAYYPFSGNADDASGNGNNGTVNGATLTIDRFGNTNSAYFFDGASGFISVTNSLLLSPVGDFCVSVWVDPTSYQSLPMAAISKAIASANNDASSSWFIAYEPADFGLPNTIQFQAWPNFGINSPTILPPPINQWHHLVFTYTRASNITASYLDGILVDTRSESYETNDPNIFLTIGCQQSSTGGGDYFFNGNIDDIRIYNRALSSNEVAQLYAIESAPIVNIQKAVYLSSNNLRTGSNYQIQASSDLINWTNQGSFFTATNSSWQSTNYWNVSDWNQLFFRLQLVP
jgi:hypothetical protein